jgi:hypothetical protein
MNGYWEGSYTGSNHGSIVVAMDDRGDHYAGFAYSYDNNPDLPSTCALIRTPDKGNNLRFTTTLKPLDPTTWQPVEWHTIQDRYRPDVTIPQWAAVECQWNRKQLSFNWTTNINTTGSAALSKSEADEPSTLTPLPIETWTDFRNHATQLEDYRFIFRGQSEPWRLRTPFHRTGRADMGRFLSEDMSYLRGTLSSRMNRLFDTSDPIQYAALMHLAQHHGYPTPLLDWTHSPFIAAFFAFNDVPSSNTSNETKDAKARIFIFDSREWCRKFPQIPNMSGGMRHVSVVEPLSIGNDRLIPQQALSTVSTVDDIEPYIANHQLDNIHLLDVIDLPISQRDQVMKELRQMGITAGLLFPGIEGACRDAKERFFRYATTSR